MDELFEDFIETASRIVYATLATVDRHGRPRSRVVHPVWTVDDGRLVGRVGSFPTPLKRAHIEHSPFASCLYWDDQHDVAVADCAAAWVPEDELEDAWRRLAEPPAPMGYDPSTIWKDGPHGADFEVLRLDPWRIAVRGAEEMAAKRPYRSWRENGIESMIGA